jgi:hypothetical protein
VTVNATALKAASVSNDWMTPVPYALESRSSVDTQALRAELVAAGVLKNTTTTNSSQTKSFFFITSSSEINATEALKGAGTQKVLPIFNGKYEPFEQWLQRKIDTNDRIIVRDGNFWSSQTTVSYGFRETLTIVYQQFNGDKATPNLQLWCAMPVQEVDPKACTLFSPGLSTGKSISTATLLGGTVTKPVPPQINSQIMFKGTQYKVIPLGAVIPSGTTTSFKVEK